MLSPRVPLRTSKYIFLRLDSYPASRPLRAPSLLPSRWSNIWDLDDVSNHGKTDGTGQEQLSPWQPTGEKKKNPKCYKENFRGDFSKNRPWSTWVVTNSVMAILSPGRCEEISAREKKVDLGSSGASDLDKATWPGWGQVKGGPLGWLQHLCPRDLPWEGAGAAQGGRGQCACLSPASHGAHLGNGGGSGARGPLRGQTCSWEKGKGGA